MKKIRAAVVETGFISSAHIKVLRYLSNVEVTGLADNTAEIVYAKALFSYLVIQYAPSARLISYMI